MCGFCMSTYPPPNSKDQENQKKPTLLGLFRYGVDVGENRAAALVLTHGSAAEVLGDWPGGTARVVALAKEAVLAKVRGRVLLVSPRALPLQPRGRLSGLLGGPGAGASGRGELLAAHVVGEAAVVLGHVPVEAVV